MTGIAERRDDLRGKDDIRVARTRQRLIDAFTRAVTSGATPSVASLCREAMVGRTTFYTHFATLEDLAVTLVADAFGAIADADVEARREGGRSRDRIAYESLRWVVAELDDLRGILLAGIRLGTRAGVLERLVDLVAEHTRPIVAPSFEDPAASGIAARFLAAAVVHAVVGWIESDEPVSEGELVTVLAALLPPFLVSPAGA